MKTTRVEQFDGRAARWPGRRCRRRAFTLIELLVVIGLIALLGGGVGLALRDRGAQELAGAQRMLAGWVAASRAEASAQQTEARLLIYGERPPAGETEKFLRLVQVVAADPAGTGGWRAVSAPVLLPRGVYFIPDTVESLVAEGVTWPEGAGATSSLGTANFDPMIDERRFGRAHWLAFRADGSVGAAESGEGARRILLTTGRVENGLPKFTHPSRVRGVVVRPTGAVTLVDQPEDL